MSTTKMSGLTLGLPSLVLMEMYEKMVLIRTFELKLKELYTAGEIIGTLHLSAGEEAVSVGVCANLSKDDYLTTTHRGHGHLLAKGSDVNKMMAEFFGKETGLCKGKGGDMHLADYSVGVLGAMPIVGGGMPPAVGAGLSAKLRGTKQVAVPIFGDGASNQGTFHESMNLASIWKLPVIFVCENNHYAESMKIEESSAVEVAQKACAYNMPGVKVDGMDVLAVYQAMHEAVERARSGQGPTLLDAITYRFEGHFVGDMFHLYQGKEELDGWRMKDPITSFAKKLVAEGIATERDINAINEQVRQQVEAAVRFARESPEPKIEEAFEGVFAAQYY